MLRALGEYHVGGIPTTLPFFRWMLQQPAFIDGVLDTTMLDAELDRRAGAPFITAEPSQLDTALLAVASTAFMEARRAGRSMSSNGVPARSGWAAAARLAALRK